MQLCELYNNDSIFDKFDCCLSGDGIHFATGSYRFFLYTQTVVANRGMGNIIIRVCVLDSIVYQKNSLACVLPK